MSLSNTCSLRITWFARATFCFCSLNWIIRHPSKKTTVTSVPLGAKKTFLTRYSRGNSRILIGSYLVRILPYDPFPRKRSLAVYFLTQRPLEKGERKCLKDYKFFEACLRPQGKVKQISVFKRIKWYSRENCLKFKTTIAKQIIAP